jgi:hypothetical protein
MNALGKRITVVFLCVLTGVLLGRTVGGMWHKSATVVVDPVQQERILEHR